MHLCLLPSFHMPDCLRHGDRCTCTEHASYVTKTSVHESESTVCKCYATRFCRRSKIQPWPWMRTLYSQSILAPPSQCTSCHRAAGNMPLCCRQGCRRAQVGRMSELEMLTRLGSMLPACLSVTFAAYFLQDLLLR